MRSLTQANARHASTASLICFQRNPTTGPVMPPSRGGGGGTAAGAWALLFQAVASGRPQLALLPLERAVPLLSPCIQSRPLGAAAAAQRFSRRASRKQPEEEEVAVAAEECEDPLERLLARDSKRRRERADSVSQAMLDGT